MPHTLESQLFPNDCFRSPSGKSSLTNYATRIRKRRTRRSTGIEILVDLAAIAFSLPGILIAMGCLLTFSLFGILAAIASAVSTIIQRLLLRCLAEHTRLQKKIAGVPALSLERKKKPFGRVATVGKCCTLILAVMVVARLSPKTRTDKNPTRHCGKRRKAAFGLRAFTSKSTVLSEPTRMSFWSTTLILTGAACVIVYTCKIEARPWI